MICVFFQSLGLLINLVEYSKKNLSALNAAVAPSPGSEAANEAAHQKEDHSAVEALMQLFLIRLEAAKENSGMEEDLTKLNSKKVFSCSNTFYYKMEHF